MPLFGKPNVRKMKEEGDVKGLIKALSYTKDPYTCEFAVDALGQIGDPAAVEPLISALAGKVPNRLNVAVALGQIGDPRAIEPLAATFKNWNEIPEVTLALGQSGDQRAVEPLILMLKDFLTSNRQVIAAIAALGKLKNPAALKPLLEIAGTEQPWSQSALESAKMIEPNLDGKNLNLVSCWSTHRTNVYSLQSHNWAALGDRGAGHRARDRLGKVRIVTFPALHSSGSPSLALKLQVGGKVIGYSGDGAWSESLLAVCRR